MYYLVSWLKSGVIYGRSLWVVSKHWRPYYQISLGCADCITKFLCMESNLETIGLKALSATESFYLSRTPIISNSHFG